MKTLLLSQYINNIIHNRPIQKSENRLLLNLRISPKFFCSLLTNENTVLFYKIILFQLIRHCWEEKPSARPTFTEIKKQLHNINPNKVRIFCRTLKEDSTSTLTFIPLTFIPPHLHSPSPSFPLTFIPPHLHPPSPSFPLTFIPPHLHSPSTSFPLTFIPLTFIPPHIHFPSPSFPLTFIPPHIHFPSPSFPLTFIPPHLHSPSPSFPLTFIPSYLHSPSPSFPLTFCILLQSIPLEPTLGYHNAILRKILWT